jgi:cellulose synthase operon protein C
MQFIGGIVYTGLLALMLAASAGCDRGLTPEESIAKAKVLIDKGELRPALIELSNAVQGAPASQEGRWLLGKVALELGDGAKAEKEIRKALELGQTRQSAQPFLVKSIMLQGDLERVVKETASIPEDMSSANKAMVLGIRAHALILQGKMDLARSVLENVLRIEPNSVEGLVGMVALEGVKRDLDAANRWIVQALKARPDAPEVWSSQGDLAIMQGDMAKARDAFGKAIKLHKYPTMDIAKHALLLIQVRQFQAAENDIQTLKKEGFGKHPYVAYVTGMHAFAQKKYPQAAESFEASQSVDPNNRLNNLYLAVTYHLMGQQEKAHLLAKRLNAEAPRSASVKQLLGDIQVSRVEYDEARSTLQRALDAQPQNANLLDMLTSVALLQGDSAKGLEYASRLANLTPNSGEAQAKLQRAKLLAGQALDSPTERSSIGDVFNTELLLTLEMLRNKQPAQALERARKLHNQFPDKPDPLNLMAAAYLMLGQQDKAKAELEASLKLKPNEPSATLNLVRIEIFKRNIKRARELLVPLVKAYPGDEEAVLLLVAVEGRSGNTAAAIPLLEQAMQHNPGALGARNMLAAEYLRAGKVQNVVTITQGLSDAQYQRQPTLLELRGKALMLASDAISARKVFQQWSKLAPDSAAAHFYYGDSLARNGEIAAARNELERAVRLNPRYLPARVGEIKIIVQDKQLARARNALEKLRKDFGEHPDVLAIEGWFALGTNNFAEAEKKLAAALKLKPDTDTAVLLSRAMFGQQKHDQSLKSMQDWLNKRPDDLVMRLHLAGAYLSLNRNEDARQIYAKVVEKYPDHVPALNNLAWLGQDKDLAQSIKHAQHALSIAPKDPYVKDTLGMLMVKRGDLTAAHNLLQEAVTLMPKAPQFQLHLAQILIKQQRLVQAGKLLNELIIKAPSSPEAKEARSLLAGLGGAK